MGRSKQNIEDGLCQNGLHEWVDGQRTCVPCFEVTSARSRAKAKVAREKAKVGRVENALPPIAQINRDVKVDGLKFCFPCHTLLPLSAFTSDHSHCGKCNSAKAMRSRIRNNPLVQWGLHESESPIVYCISQTGPYATALKIGSSTGRTFANRWPALKTNSPCPLHIDFILDGGTTLEGQLQALFEHCKTKKDEDTDWFDVRILPALLQVVQSDDFPVPILAMAA